MLCPVVQFLRCLLAALLLRCGNSSYNVIVKTIQRERQRERDEIWLLRENRRTLVYCT
jgi:hypothetical protein